jgi:putative ABC transport system permease protein
MKLGQQVPLGPLRQPYTVVGLTSGMVTSAGDPVAWVTLHDAQSLQFSKPPALERRERAAGRPPPQTGDINAVLVRLESGVPAAPVAVEIERWKHLTAVSQAEQESFLTEFVIDKMQRQLGMFMAILITVSAVILALIIYTLTMDKLRAIATLKLIGAPDRVIVGLILQQAMVLGVTAFTLGLALILAAKDRFPRRVMLEPRDVAIVFAIVLVVCLLASVLGVRTALKVDATKALAG